MKDTLEDLEQFIIDVIIHNRRGMRATFLRMVFWFLSGIYKGAVRLRLFLYRERFIHDHHLGVPVISIGNITVGGTGKTPVVELFSKALLAKGRRVAILSRGYKSKRQRKIPLSWRIAAKLGLARKPRELLPRVVSDGEKVLLDSYVAGDEPFMLAQNCKGVPVVVDRNRVKAGAHAIRKFGADVLILDDGLQYLKLKHRHDIVLVDKTAPFGTGYMLPRGTLREPPSSLRRASYIFLTKSDGDSGEIIEQIRKHNPVAEIIECRHRPVHFEHIHTGERLPLDTFRGKYVGALSGIAVPESFENGLRKLGAKVHWVARFTDHHRFQEKDITQFIERCEKADAHAILTTEKDFVRFPKLPPGDIPIYFLRVEIEIIKGREIFDKLVRLIAEPRHVTQGLVSADLVETTS
ncbi:tetraacyldisaccharide 4'-kinase [Prosthecobacter algae]|uniref:Tetraacyldisaccharide 4'-kinase n=1 Tax=Prosthecobacter algae TaxID=1144682 RepID=A0ABP9PAQ9_9BACT